MKMFRKLSLLLLALISATSVVLAENTAAINDVIKLKTAGQSDDTVVNFIRSKNIYYDLSADSILRLKDQGLSQAVINAMLISGSVPTVPAAPAVEPTPTPAPVTTAVPVAQPVAATVTTVSSPVVSSATLIQPAMVTTVVAQPTITGDAAYYYQQLLPYGRWIPLEDGTWSWQPKVVVATPEWRPYWDEGHWVWTDQGWYWYSDYPWGGVAFHYGRWHLHPTYGWVWVPDRVWGPAWVVWRNSDDYCGWAPLPPGAVFDISGGFFRYRGVQVSAGFDFGLGLTHFTFCLGREMSDPFPRHYRYAPEFRVAFSRSVVVHNYSIDHGPGGSHIINRGIDPGRFRGARPDAFKPVRVRDIRPGNPTPAAPRGAAPPQSREKSIPTPSRGGEGHGFGGGPGFGGGRP